jgi:hypothetical protein
MSSFLADSSKLAIGSMTKKYTDGKAIGEKQSA